jgi:hypothetical protein
MLAKGWQVQWIIERMIDFFLVCLLCFLFGVLSERKNELENWIQSMTICIVTKFIDDDSRCPYCLSSYSTKDIFLFAYWLWKSNLWYLNIHIFLFFAAPSFFSISTITTLVDDKRNCHHRYINTCLEFELSFSRSTNENKHSPVSYRPCPVIRHRHTCMHTHFEQRSLLKGNYSLIGKQHLWFSEKMIHPPGAVDYDNEMRLHKALRIDSRFPKTIENESWNRQWSACKNNNKKKGRKEEKKRRANQRTFVHLLDMLVASEKRCDMLLELRFDEQKRASNGLFCVQMGRSSIRARLSK